MSHKFQEELADLLDKVPIEIGDIYFHYKNPSNKYKVEFLGLWEATDEICVGYRAQYGKELLFVRPLKSFLEIVEVEGKKAPRFTRIKE